MLCGYAILKQTFKVVPFKTAMQVMPELWSHLPKPFSLLALLEAAYVIAN